MGSKRNRKVDPFFLRLLGYFFVFLVFSGIVLALSSFFSRRSRRELFLARLSENFIAAAQNVDDQITTVQNLGTNFFMDSDIVLYFRPENTKSLEEKSEQWKLHKLLRQNETMLSSAVHDSFAYIVSDSVVLSAAGQYDMDYFFSDIDHYAGYDQDFWIRGLKKSDIRTILPQTSLTTKSGTLEVIPVVTTARIASRIAVQVNNLKVSGIGSLLTDNTLSGNAFFAIYRSDGVPVYVSGGQKYSESEMNAVRECGNLDIWEGKMVLREISETSGRTYAALFDDKDIFRQVNGDTSVIIALVIMLLTGGAGLTVLFSLRIYQPISEVTGKLPPPPSQSRDRLAALEEGVDLLLSRADQHDLEYCRSSLQLICSGLEPNNEEKMRTYLKDKRGFVFRKILCTLILLDFRQDFYEADEDAKACAFMRSVPQILEKYMSGDASCVAFSLQEGMYACIFDLGDDCSKKEIVVDKLKDLRRLFPGEAADYNIFLGTGNVCDGLEKLHVSFNQALAALKKCDRKKSCDSVLFSRLPFKGKVAFTFYDQKAIVNTIISGNLDSLTNCLNEIFLRNEKRGIDAENLVELEKQMFLVGIRCLDEHGMDADSLNGCRELRKYFAHPEGNGRREVMEFFTEVRQAVYEPPEDGTSSCRLADDADAYLQKHYDELLTLDGIADALGVSAKYLSLIYKRRQGRNISLTLAVIRVEKAKALLAGSNEKIGTIAREVGMDSRATFLRVFRKIEGISPSEYRNMKANAGNDAEEEY